jgi:hypothetical protein
MAAPARQADLSVAQSALLIALPYGRIALKAGDERWFVASTTAALLVYVAFPGTSSDA